mgnify:CR=1 FL=1
MIISDTDLPPACRHHPKLFTERQEIKPALHHRADQV